MQVQVEESKRWAWIILAAVALVIAAFGTYKLFIHRPPVLTEKDTIVLADFANATGDPIVAFLTIMDDEDMQRVLRLMSRPADTRITTAIAHEICIREGAAATIDCAIATGSR